MLGVYKLSDIIDFLRFSSNAINWEIVINIYLYIYIYMQ